MSRRHQRHSRIALAHVGPSKGGKQPRGGAYGRQIIVGFIALFAVLAVLGLIGLI